LQLDFKEELPMDKALQIVLLIIAALLLQVTIFPAYLADPFKPNLLIIIVCCLGLRATGLLGGGLAFILGLVLDCFSGLYLGLNGFSFLCVTLLLKTTADRFYTNNSYLMVIVVFLATIVNGLMQMLLLLLFPATTGIYATLLPALIPQGLVNALIASLLFAYPALNILEESR
jgi:rod shape-determining protein MreD